MIYTTKNLITKSWGRYKISDPHLAEKLAYLSKAFGMHYYTLYKYAYKLYKSKPHIYDWYGGTEPLLIKIAMEGVIATMESTLMSTTQIYYILKSVTNNGLLGDSFLSEPWARYGHIMEKTQKNILEKLRGFQYFKPNTGFDKLPEHQVITTIFRACYIWAWSIDQFTPKELDLAHSLYYKLLFRDIEPEHTVQAKNIIANEVNSIDHNAIVEFY